MTTIFEFVSLYKSVLPYIAHNSITAADTVAATYYEEYKNLRPAIKEEAAARMIAERHGMDIAGMINVIKRMEKEIKAPDGSTFH